MAVNIREVVDWIVSNIGEISSSKDVANHFGVRTDTLKKRFKLSQGLTMFQFIKRLKVQRTKELLRASNLRCFEIAYLLKLGSPQHAARLFKRRCGLTMSTYRKQ